MSTKIYFFDPDKQNAFSYFDIVADDAPVPSNGTTIEPFDNNGIPLLNPTWNGTSWVGVDEETWRKSLPDVEHDAATATDKDKQIALISAEMLQHKKLLNQQGQQIVSLTTEMLKLTKGAAK
jgi:hypothetical protein